MVTVIHNAYTIFHNKSIFNFNMAGFIYFNHFFFSFFFYIKLPLFNASIAGPIMSHTKQLPCTSEKHTYVTHKC